MDERKWLFEMFVYLLINFLSNTYSIPDAPSQRLILVSSVHIWHKEKEVHLASHPLLTIRCRCFLRKLPIFTQCRHACLSMFICALWNVSDSKELGRNFWLWVKDIGKGFRTEDIAFLMTDMRIWPI